MKIVGQRLKELRVNARYSQKQIAEKCETTQVTIGRYDVGQCVTQQVVTYVSEMEGLVGVG